MIWQKQSDRCVSFNHKKTYASVGFFIAIFFVYFKSGCGGGTFELPDSSTLAER